MAEEPRTRIEHPNRGKASSKVTRLVVVVLLLVSVALMLIVTLGGWSELAGATPVGIAYILVYLILAFFVARWSRGVLPLAAALAIGMGIFALIAVPGWFSRDHAGFADTTVPADVLGLICALLAIVQLLLIFFAMSGFRQAWNVEVEKPVGGDRDRDADRDEPRRRRAPDEAPTRVQDRGGEDERRERDDADDERAADDERRREPAADERPGAYAPEDERSYRRPSDQQPTREEPASDRPRREPGTGPSPAPA